MSTFWVNQHLTQNNSVNNQTAETAEDSSCQGLSEEGGWENRVSVLQDEENPTSSQWVVMAPQQYGYTTQVHS